MNVMGFKKNHFFLQTGAGFGGVIGTAVVLYCVSILQDVFFKKHKKRNLF